MNNKLTQAIKAFENNNLNESFHLVEAIIDHDPEKIDTEAFMLKAKILYRQQKWGDTLNILNKILNIDPTNKQACNYKTIIQNILTFWHKDNYNP